MRALLGSKVKKMLDIILVNPYPDRAKGINEATVTPPLGLAYLAAVLKRDGFAAKIIDANVLKKENAEVIKEIKAERPRFVGISMNIVTAEPGYRLSRELKSSGIGTKVILGGVTASTDPQDCLKRTGADFLIKGEGEETLLELMKSEKNGEALPEKIAGLAFSREGRLNITAVRNRIRDLDSLPLPAYELLPPLKFYKSRARGFPVASIFTSRGCPYSCIFCNKSVFGAQITFHSPKRVLDEISFLIDNYGVRQIDILDDHFTFDKKRAMEILEGIIRSGRRVFINLQNGIRADTVDEELIKTMRRAGVYKIGLGVESADPEIQKRIKKNLDVEKAIFASKLAKKYGILVYGFFILGLPGEDRRSMQKTIDFALKMDPLIANFSIALPFPGTEMYGIIQKEGRFLKPVDVECLGGFYEGSAYFEAGPTKKEDVEEMFRRAYTVFYLRPKKIWDLLTSVRSLKELAWMMEATFASQSFRVRKKCQAQEN